MADDEGWPRGTTGQLAPAHAALVTGAAWILLALFVATGCVAGLLILRALV